MPAQERQVLPEFREVPLVYVQQELVFFFRNRIIPVKREYILIQIEYKPVCGPVSRPMPCEGKSNFGILPGRFGKKRMKFQGGSLQIDFPFYCRISGLPGKFHFGLGRSRKIHSLDNGKIKISEEFRRKR